MITDAQGYRVADSWSGSEKSRGRGSRGGFSKPKTTTPKPSSQTYAKRRRQAPEIYLVASGTPAHTRKQGSQGPWSPFTTTKANRFPGRNATKEGPYYIFTWKGHQLRVAAKHVTRETARPSEPKRPSAGSFLLRFGCHAGKQLRDCPRDYLDFLVGLQDPPETLRAAHKAACHYLAEGFLGNQVKRPQRNRKRRT